MIIYLIFLLVIVVILSWTLINNRTWRWLIGLTNSIALVAAVSIMTLNFSNHYGMKKETIVETHQIYSAAGDQSPMQIIVAKQLGTKSKHWVMVYRDSQAVKASTHFVPQKKHIVEMVKKQSTLKKANVDHATVKTTTIRWEWKNDTAKFWLNIGDQASELVSQKSVVTVPENWQVLSPSQLKQLKKKMAAQQSAQKQALMAQASSNQ
ncbi:DUF4811 domain-containing protein [Limosilactobacillus mucosae]|uniref:DUF4811 domain-containing protein n=1 Tax=Limosilactobacillus mucosae TaxID=97478 RepID=A0AAJ1HWH7_LIMMU|nr:DUF4811 domain-containing protein [Limosilactobacillus mucosae]MDC2829875.1 DUF4811 domain-containing protein [Limosilactobacillus mucosae]MDC2837331.1 DUF4811 domain-containing protein [Limosilactobacillus mucosae]MDC2849553.1 DUF4811 domain-containing protein [Limosilactobacillus mucosae]MDC2853599.1 DUF4811 domain-containing protein [Limosilactobacillus mucosae]